MQKTWDDGDPEPMDGLFWESAHNEPPTTMTAAQIEAAQLLGHTTETWNHGMTQDDAATKIGAVFRGRKERKALAVRTLPEPNLPRSAALVSAEGAEWTMAGRIADRAYTEMHNGCAAGAEGRGREGSTRVRCNPPARLARRSQPADWLGSCNSCRWGQCGTTAFKIAAVLLSRQVWRVPAGPPPHPPPLRLLALAWTASILGARSRAAALAPAALAMAQRARKPSSRARDGRWRRHWTSPKALSNRSDFPVTRHRQRCVFSQHRRRDLRPVGQCESQACVVGRLCSPRSAPFALSALNLCSVRSVGFHSPATAEPEPEPQTQNHIRLSAIVHLSSTSLVGFIHRSGAE